jgi:hypothetical protein
LNIETLNCGFRVAPLKKNRYIRIHALLTPHFAFALYRQLAGGAEAARRALTYSSP